MKRLALAVIAVSIQCFNSFGQDPALWWFNNANLISPTNAATLLPGSTDPSIGALVQLIRDGGNGVANAPSGFGTTGITGDDSLAFTWMVGGGGEGDGQFFKDATLASLNLGLSSSVYVRVWDHPSSGSGNIPSPFDYGGGLVGAYYFDDTVRLVNANPQPGNIYNYVITDIVNPNQWTFLAIPEPGTMALAGLGLAAMLIRARRKIS